MTSPGRKEKAMGASIPVFVETKLGHHLALTILLSDAVLDLKKKIEVDFPLSYPDIGEVKVESLKARREGKFFSVSDAVPVSSFCEANGSCFVTIEARALRERVDGCGFLGPEACKNAVGSEAKDNLREGASALGALEARSNQKSDHKKGKRGKKKRKRDEENDASSLDAVVSESWVANAVAGALCDVKGGTKRVAEGPSMSASSDISTMLRHKVRQADVLLEGVDSCGEVVMCEKNESRNEASNVNLSEDVEDASDSNSIVVAKKRRKIDKRKTDAVSMKENRSLVSENRESEVVRDDPSSRNSTLKPCSIEDPEGVHSLSNVIGHNKKKSRKKTMDTAGNDLFKVPAAPMSEHIVFDPPTFSGKDCDLGLKGSDHASSPLGNATIYVSNDDQTYNIGENHYFMNKRLDDREEFDQHGKDDGLHSLQNSGVKEDLRCGVENEHDIVMGESVLETGSHKKTKRIVKRGHKRAEECDASLHQTDKKGSEENVAVQIDETSELVKAPVTVDSGKSSKKPRKSKDKKDVKMAPASGAEHVEGPRIDITLSQPLKFVNDSLSVDVDNKEDKGSHKDEKMASEMGAVIPSVVLSDGGIVHEVPDSSPLIESTQANIAGEEGKSKKKLKKIKSSGPRINITPSQSLKVVNDALSVDVGNKETHKDEKMASEMGTVIPSVVLSDGGIVHEAPDSSSLMESTQANVVGEEGKSKKKLKKIKSLGGKELDQHSKVDRNQSLQSSGVKEDLRCGVENEHDIVMGESVLETESHKKTKRIVKKGPKRAEEGDASLHQTDKKGSEENVAVRIDETSELVKAPVTVDSDKSSKKPRKSKHKKDLNMAPASGAEHVEGPIIDITLSQPLKVVNDSLSVDIGNKEDKGSHKDEKMASEMGDVIPSVVLSDGGIVHEAPDSSHLIENTQANIAGEEGKSKKKLKKIKSSGPRINITPSQSLKVVNDAQSVDVGNKETHKDENIASEMGAVIPSVVLSDGGIVHEAPNSSPLMETTQANVVGEEGKSKKKLKKIKSSGGKVLDQHGKVDRNQSLQSSGVKEDLRCVVENEQDIVMGESVLENGSHKKTKRIATKGHKRAEEGDALLHETDEKGSKENVAVLIDETYELVKAPVTVGSGKSSKKPRNSKDKKDVNESPTSGAEPTEGPRIEITPSQSLKVVKDVLSVDVGNIETHKDENIASEIGIPSVVLSDGAIVHKAPDSSQLTESTQANVLGEEEKSKKTLKKIKSSGAKDVANLLLGRGKDNPQAQELSMSDDKDTGFSPEKMKQTAQEDACGVNMFTRSKENVAVPINETSELVKAPVTVDSGKSSRKPRNSKGKKDVNGAPTSGAEHTEGSKIESTPSQSLKVATDALSVDVSNKEDKGTRKDEKIASEMGAVIPSVVLSDGGGVHKAPDCSPLMESTQANIVEEEGKSKKKLKKIKSSAAKDVAKLLLEKGKDNPQAQESSMSNDKDMGFSSKKSKKTDQVDASGASRLTRSEENVAVPIDETSELVKAPVTVDSGKSSKKQRIYKDKKDVNEAPASGAEHTEVPTIEITPSQSLRVVNALSVDVGNKDEKNASEMGIPSVVLSVGGIVYKAADSSPLMESSQSNIVGEEGKSKKKLKKIKSSGAKDLAKLLLEKERDNNPQAQESSMSNDKDVGFSSEKSKQTDQDDTSGVCRLTRSKSRRGGVEDNPSEAYHENEASNDMEASSRSDGINFREYFGRSEGHENVVSGEATTGATDGAKQIGSKTNGDKMENARPWLKSTNQLSTKENRVNGGPKKISANNAGEAVNSSEPERRLHEKPVALSEVNMDGSCTNEDSPAFSDASTRTPSDYSLSSDYSDGGSNTVNSLNKGSTKDGGKKSKKAIMSAMSLNEILRSSRSYKKAKISASQTLLEDTESQSVDVVPDSCPGL